MKIKSLVLGMATVALLGSCSGSNDNYTLDVVLDNDDANGTMAYLYDFDTDAVMDSVLVSEGKAVFTGHIEKPLFVKLVVNGRRAGSFILENGNTEFKDGSVASALNDELESFIEDYSALRDSLVASIDSTLTDEEKEAVYEKCSAYLDSVVNGVMIEKINTPVGYYLLLNQYSGMSYEEFKAIIDEYPHLAEYQRVDKIAKSFEAKEATSDGKQYTDFEVEYNGETVKLSDYVKPGQYTLVDFWASWCGPCKREIEIVKELYAKYHDKGLDVVGVTVLEEPEATVAYLEEHPLPWNVILNAQSGPTDLYGINGIPCIMLIGPDGVIVKRDLFDDDLVNTVSAAMDDNK